MLSLISERELSILKQFKENVSDLNVDEETCLRFLIARDFDLDKASDMLRNNVKWRSEVNISFLLNEWTIPNDIKEDFKYSFCGTSLNGGPIFWIPGGQWTVRRFVEQGRREEILKFCIKTLEESLVRVKEHGNRPLVAVYDFAGLTYYKVSHLETTRVIYAGFQLLEQNYPEILDKVVIVNAPYPFYIAWNIINPLLSKRTSSKIHVFGSDKKKYGPLLRQLCPEDTIPTTYLI